MPRRSCGATLACLLGFLGGGVVSAGNSRRRRRTAGEPPPPFERLDFAALPSDLPEAIREVRRSQKWQPRNGDSKRDGVLVAEDQDARNFVSLKMNRTVLTETIKAGCAFMSHWQLPEGNFRYLYDWQSRVWVDDDNQVRQAGSPWGISLCYHHEPTPELQRVLDKSMDFWIGHSVPGPAAGTLIPRYPNTSKTETGTVALLSLALIDYLTTEAHLDEARRARLDKALDGYLATLRWLQFRGGLFSQAFRHGGGTKADGSNPYANGEALLALCKAARRLGKREHLPAIKKAARAAAEAYTVKAWAEARNSKLTKGFYQWGSMAFAEYHDAGWEGHELFDQVALALGHWMLHTHRVLEKPRNHAYAVEGLVAAWRIARALGDVDAQADLLFTLDRSLYKLGAWQIGGPLSWRNRYLVRHGTDDPMAQGGVMNAAKPSGKPVRRDVSHQLRIDVAHHQMHAALLGLQHVYPASGSPPPSSSLLQLGHERGVLRAGAVDDSAHHPTCADACSTCKSYHPNADCSYGDCGDGSGQFCWVDKDPPAGYKNCGTCS